MRLVPAVLRAFSILDTLADAPEPLKVSQLAARLDVPRNTTYELVNTLVHLRAAEFAPDGRVALSRHLFELGSRYAQSLNLVSEAQVVARQLVDVHNETVHVAILEGLDVLYIVKQDSRQDVRMVSALGRRLPAHCTAVGKVLLAHLEPQARALLTDGVELRALTSRSITSHDALERELALIRDRGFATDDRESNEDVRCVAAPIRDERGQVIAGMSISVPTVRMDQRRQRALAAAVSEAADDLSSRLGYLARSGG